MLDVSALKATAPDLLSLAESITTLRKTASSNGGEWSGPCPFCGRATHNGFVVQPHASEARWLCRKCTDGKWQDVINFIERRDNLTFLDAVKALFGPAVQLSPDRAEALQAERRAAEEAKRLEEERSQAERRAALEASGAWAAYYDNLRTSPQARALWASRGIPAEWQDYYRVGYSPAHTFWHNGASFESASLTIPTFRANFSSTSDPEITWTCVGLAHRLLMEDAPGGKYRPHLAGTGKPLFMADLIAPRIMDDVILVEGEVKAMVAHRFIQEWGYEHAFDRLHIGRVSVVGAPGKSFKSTWVPEFADAQHIWICLDPDADSSADSVAHLLDPARCRIIDLPGKVDDMLLAGRLDARDLDELLFTARSVR